MDVLESVDNNGFENALEESLDTLENMGLFDLEDETPVFIILGKNGKIIDGSFGVDARIFIGGSVQEVIDNLQDSINNA
jgi:hypothetical protein